MQRSVSLKYLVGYLVVAVAVFLAAPGDVSFAVNELTVSVSPAVGNKVSFNYGGPRECVGTCVFTVTPPATITFTALSAAGYVFDSWQTGTGGSITTNPVTLTIPFGGTLTLVALFGPPNNPPVLQPIGNKAVNEGKLLTFDISATDVDPGDTITYSALNLPAGASFGGSTFSWQPGYDQAGSYLVTFRAYDGTASDQETITITVNEGNPPPVVDVTSTPLTAFNDGATPVLLTASVSDASGASDIASVEIDLSSFGGSASQPMYDDATHGDAAAGNGVYSFRTTVSPSTLLGQKALPVVATDQAGGSGSDSAMVSVIEKITDTVAPGFTSTHEFTNRFTGQTLTIEYVLSPTRLRQTCATTLTVKKPDGTTHSTHEILTQESTITIPHAEAGIWTYEVSTACTGERSYSISTGASGTGVITGTVTASGTEENLTGVEIKTTTGGIALSLSGHYVLVAPAGLCTVTASGYGYKSCSQYGVTVTSGGEVTADLTLEPLESIYFPHIASNSVWETEIGILNPSATQTVTGTLRPFGDSGAATSTTVPVTLAPHGRRGITISQGFTNPDTIGYMRFESDSSAVKGYTKFYRQGLFRAAIPAAGALYYGDVYLPHVTSDPNWWTGVSLLNANTSFQTQNLRFVFNNGMTINRSIAANEHQKFLVSDLFGGQTPAGISSAVVKNGGGVIGLELFSSANQMEGIPITDDTATTLYFPHLPSDSTWWTGIVAYNPSASACTLTITPYRPDGTVLTSITRSLAGNEKLSVLATGLGLPADTGWVEINATSAVTGFALIGTTDWNQVGGFYGIGAKKKEGVFAKLEKGGGWSYLTLVNTEASTTSVTLTAYNDSGTQVATTTFSLGAHGKAENTAEGFFPTQSISTATYLAYSSDKELVGLQLNASADGTMLDGMPGL
jgi:hypothetical protein